MRVRSSLAFTFLPLLTSLCVACGDDTTTGGGGAGGGSGGSGGAGGSEAPPPPEDCGDVLVITQKGTTSTLYSTGGVGFEFEPAMGLAEPDVITVSPQYQGIIQTGTRDLIGAMGVVEVYASVDAVVDLINAPFGTVDGRLFIAIGGRATIEAAPETGTQFKGRVAGSLQDAYFIELDDNLDPIVGGDCLYLADGAFDAASYQASCDAPAVAPSGGACLPFAEIGHECNPITNEGCDAGEICDWGGTFQCYPVEGTEVGLCEPCHGLDGPKCGQGLTCDSDMSPGVCHKYCCTDADCGAGGECIAYSFAPWNMGVCLSP